MEELIQHLGHVAEADPIKHKKSLKTLIDYLLYVSLINLTEETGEIKLSNDNEHIEESMAKQPTISKVPIIEEAAEEKSIEKKIVQDNKIKSDIFPKNQINVNISIELTISPETSEEDIKGKVGALIEALKDL